jgi:hypothetical protein
MIPIIKKKNHIAINNDAEGKKQSRFYVSVMTKYTIWAPLYHQENQMEKGRCRKGRKKRKAGNRQRKLGSQFFY